MKPTLSDLSDAQLSRELVTWQEIALQSDCKRVAAEGDRDAAMRQVDAIRREQRIRRERVLQ